MKLATSIINTHIEEQVLQEFKFYQQELKFEKLILQAPLLSSEIQQKQKERAIKKGGLGKPFLNVYIGHTR